MSQFKKVRQKEFLLTHRRSACFFSSLLKDISIDFKERERERERDRGRKEERERNRKRKIDVREKHRLVASCPHPNRGLNMQPRYVPWPGIEPATFWCAAGCSKQLRSTLPEWASAFCSIQAFTWMNDDHPSNKTTQTHIDYSLTTYMGTLRCSQIDT